MVKISLDEKNRLIELYKNSIPADALRAIFHLIEDVQNANLSYSFTYEDTVQFIDTLITERNAALELEKRKTIISDGLKVAMRDEAIEKRGNAVIRKVCESHLLPKYSEKHHDRIKTYVNKLTGFDGTVIYD